MNAQDEVQRLLLSLQPQVVADLVRRSRTELGMNFEQLGALAGVSSRSIRNIENGRGAQVSLLSAVLSTLDSEYRVRRRVAR